MLTAYQLLNRDLDVFDEMLFELEAYLHGRDTQWELTKPRMPLLTLGGMLMRHQRLAAMHEGLDFTRHPWFEQASERFARTLRENVVEVERRAHEELHLLIKEWLHEVQHFSAADRNHYAHVVDTRVAIELLLDLLKEAPYLLDPHLVDEVTLLDENLRQRWQTGPFVWPLPYVKAYTRDKYWWLYGHVMTVPSLQTG